MGSVRIAGYQDEGITGAGEGTVVPFSQAPWATHKSNLEVLDFAGKRNALPGPCHPCWGLDLTAGTGMMAVLRVMAELNR